MINFALTNIQKMASYSPPLAGRREYSGLLLDFNERTIPVSKNVTKALQKFLGGKNLQVYPEYFDVSEKIARYCAVNSDQIMLTNGSDQGIDLIFRTFTKRKSKVIIPSPSFAMFYQCAEIADNKIVTPLYREDLSFPFEEVLEAIDEQTKLVVICNPNNPTGTIISPKNIERIVKKAFSVGAITYVDEAYFEFSKVTAIPLLKFYPNLIITRTFSKAFGLASLRLGYIIANKELIIEMQKVQGPYDINMPAIYAALASLGNIEDIQNYVDEVMEKAKPKVENFFKEKDIKFFLSAANFILFKPKNAKTVFEKLKENGVLVRPRGGERIEETVRITIGTVSQMEEFIKAYKLIDI